MRVLVVGSGGREHTLVWKISQSMQVEKIYCAPGNGGTAQLAENINIAADDINALADFAEQNKIDLTVAGPELPLVNGIVDEFQKRNLKIFGPSKKAAELEGSKAFSKKIMVKYGIPTAETKIFDNAEEAIAYAKTKTNCVVKADGLAAGKGVLICKSAADAVNAVNKVLVEKAFGSAGNRVIIEELLEGEEASFLVFSDGKTIKPMVSSQDHKRIFDGDKGLNTGGMGAYSPAPVVTAELQQEIMEKVMKPAVEGMAKEGTPYVGVLYAGIMVTEKGPKVLEFNARFGDPETQVILPRLDSDLVEIMLACADGKLAEQEVNWKEDACTCIVIASGGYPENYEKGKEISGLEDAAKMPGAFVFHAGTKIADGKTVTSGGRVLGVTALGKTINDSIEKAYAAASKISFEKMHYRKDIGYRALARE